MDGALSIAKIKKSLWTYIVGLGILTGLVTNLLGLWSPIINFVSYVFLEIKFPFVFTIGCLIITIVIIYLLSNTGAELENTISHYEWYRPILKLCEKPMSFDEINKNYGGVDLQTWLKNLKDEGGLKFTDGKWVITKRGSEMLSKYGES